MWYFCCLLKQAVIVVFVFFILECLLLFSADVLYSLSCRSYWTSACYRWSIEKQKNTSGLYAYHGHLTAAAEDKAVFT